MVPYLSMKSINESNQSTIDQRYHRFARTGRIFFIFQIWMNHIVISSKWKVKGNHYLYDVSPKDRYSSSGLVIILVFSTLWNLSKSTVILPFDFDIQGANLLSNAISSNR